MDKLPRLRFQSTLCDQIEILRDALLQRSTRYGNTFDEHGLIEGYEKEKALKDAAQLLDDAVSALERA